ncbi:hypothetical protein V6617_16810 [Pelagibacterium nitratireducens]|uniref:Uncharacterized protein n=1 Tax=Pelagibacterium nitratireducens TaxID=1046114 RepID=A0ABZ2I6A8_9HYPH
MTIRQSDKKRIKALAEVAQCRQRSKPTMTVDEAAAAYEQSLNKPFVARGDDDTPRILTTHTVEEAADIYRRYIEEN